MTKISPHAPEDAFLETYAGAMALELAMRRGLIDRLALDQSVALEDLDLPPGADFFPVLLERAKIVSRKKNQLSLSPKFKAIWPARRNALQHKLRFLKAASVDLAMGMADLVGDLPGFMKRAHTFEIFDYSKAMLVDQASLDHTQMWCDYVAVLTEAEAPEITAVLDLDPGARVLEIGGNVGVMASALMTAFGVEVTVLDLAGVCVLGEQRNAARASGARPKFIGGNALEGDWNELPGAPWDAIVFKSVLHDWPEEVRGALMDHAKAALRPGGQIVVAERGPIAPRGALPFWMSADLIFAPFYQSASYYADVLGARGCAVTSYAPELGLPFHITVGTVE